MTGLTMAHHMAYRSAMADRHTGSRAITLRLPHALADSVEAGAAGAGLSRNAFVAALLGRGTEMRPCTPGELVYNAARGAGLSHDAALEAVRRMHKPGRGVSPTGETGTVGDPLLSPTVPPTDGNTTER